jgi:hypothetical protein
MTVVPSSPPACGGTSSLTGHDRRVIAQARELAADSGLSHRAGEARFLLAELAAIAERAGR